MGATHKPTKKRATCRFCKAKQEEKYMFKLQSPKNQKQTTLCRDCYLWITKQGEKYND